MLHLSTRKSCSNNRVQPFAFPENKIARWALANNRAICDRYHSQGKSQRLYKGLRVHDRKGDSMTRIILTVIAALAVTIGALTITGAGDDSSSTPTMLALPLLY